MKFQTLIEIIKERLAGTDVLAIWIFGMLAFIAIVIATWRLGGGFLISLTFIFSGFLLLASDMLSGFALFARFPLAIVLVLYAFFSRRNRIRLSAELMVWLLLPIVMLINSFRAYDIGDALLQGFLYFAFFIGIILGGQRIFGDERGRAVFARCLVFFTILMTCIQVPFYIRSPGGFFEGTFRSTVGFMIIGTTGVIVLVWFALKQKFGSTKFVFYALFSALTFILMLLTGGRTAIGATLLGILALLARRLRRNAVILLATVIILAPIGLRIIVSFPGFEDVKYKLFSTTTTGRAELWTLAWDEIRQKPVIGWGTGSAYIKSVQAKGMTYHQTYLEFAVDHGIPFAVIMLVAFSWLPFRGILLMKRCQTEEMKDMVDLSSALLTGYLFSSFLGGVLNAATFVLPVYTAIALQEGIRAENREMEFYGLDEYDEGYLWADHSEEILSGGFLR